MTGLLATMHPFALLTVGMVVGGVVAFVLGLRFGTDLERQWWAERGCERIDYRG